MKNISFKEQNKILKKHFGITVKASKKPVNLHPEAEGIFAVPKWQKLGKTYPEALQKVLDAIKSTRPFHNWRDGQIDEKHIRRLNAGNDSFELPEIFSAQLGRKYKGVSVDNARKQTGKSELLLGAYEIGIILLTHPDALSKYEDLWINCSADELSYYGDGFFSYSLYFDFDDSELEFGSRFLGVAHGHYGSGSLFLSGTNTVLTQNSTDANIKICHTKQNLPESTISIKESGNDVVIQVTPNISITVAKE